MMFEVVTGGAGFIGSHLVDYLVECGHEVVVIDSLTAGSLVNLQRHEKNRNVRIVKSDLMTDGWQDACAGAERVYHLAADPDVRLSSINPDTQIRNNILVTYRVLEAMRAHRIQEIVFTSTSTVYGEARVIPTPEDYAPMEPISVYGASKLSCEALISAYCHSYGMRSWIYRFANIIGPRSGHGVITDFIRKLRENTGELQILGDGSQSKSYLEVGSCIEAMVFAAAHAKDRVNIFNIGSEDWIDVKSIADIVVEEMHLPPVKYQFTGGERGWVGDVPRMLLDIEKIKKIGWKPANGSREYVRMAVSALLKEAVPRL